MWNMYTVNMWNTIKVGTQNVGGFEEIGKLIVDRETNENFITGLSETHWKGAGHFTTTITTLYIMPDAKKSPGTVWHSF